MASAHRADNAGAAGFGIGQRSAAARMGRAVPDRAGNRFVVDLEAQSPFNRASGAARGGRKQENRMEAERK